MANVRQSFIAPPPAASSMSRQGAASPNNVGIALNPSDAAATGAPIAECVQSFFAQTSISLKPGVEVEVTISA
jgi:hypothetical protein